MLPILQGESLQVNLAIGSVFQTDKKHRKAEENHANVSDRRAKAELGWKIWHQEVRKSMREIRLCWVFLSLGKKIPPPGIWSRMRQLETDVEDSKKDVRGRRENMRRFINITNDLKKEFLAWGEKIRKLKR